MNDNEQKVMDGLLDKDFPRIPVEIRRADDPRNMVDPLRRNMDYTSVARKTLDFDTLGHDPLNPVVGCTYVTKDGFRRTVTEIKANGAVWWTCPFGEQGATDAETWRRMHTPETPQIEMEPVYHIVGSQQNPDVYAFPMRLSAVVKHGAAYLLELADASGIEQWAEEDASYIDELFETGDLHLFGGTIPYKPGYVLLQVSQGMPEYLPLALLRERLDELHQEALVRAEQALATGTLELAEERAWFAARAKNTSVLARLLLVALLREKVPEAQLSALWRRLPSHDPAAWALALTEAANSFPHIVRAISVELAKRENQAHP